MLCNICNSHMHLCAYLLENVPPLQDSKPMHIWGNRPWGSTSTPQLCKAFFKEPIGRFWGKLWISITSHQFLAWSWQNSYVLANHTHPFHPIFHLLQLLVGQLWWCKGGGGGGVMLQQDKYILGNYGIKDAKGHLWVWNRKLVMWGCQDILAPFHILAMPSTSNVGDVPSSQPKV
jgi:hypothetical protein